jgi:hypothetical protein
MRHWRKVEPLLRTISKRSWTQSYPLQRQIFGDSHRPPANKNIFKMLVLFDLMAVKSTVFWGEAVYSGSTAILLAQYMAPHPRRQYSSSLSSAICMMHFTFQQINTPKQSYSMGHHLCSSQSISK